jgi:predicted nucleic acid-binding Zn ribbon protein
MKYDFTCPSCTHAEEVEVSMNEISGYELKCSKCETKMIRQFQNPFVRFIGRDFYVNEYKTKNLGGGMQLRHK